MHLYIYIITFHDENLNLNLDSNWQFYQDSSMVGFWRSEFESRFRFKFFSWNVMMKDLCFGFNMIGLRLTLCTLIFRYPEGYFPKALSYGLMTLVHRPANLTALYTCGDLWKQCVENQDGHLMYIIYQTWTMSFQTQCNCVPSDITKAIVIILSCLYST